MGSNFLSKKGFYVFLMTALVSLISFAGQLTCDSCGMYVSENSKNHVVLTSEDSLSKPKHACSPTCVHKLQKHDPKYNKVVVNDFNHPEKKISGDKAFFLIQSSKIKSDMGPDVMAPYAAAFSTKEEAEAAKAKYGDGIVVKGAENAFKK